MAGCLGTPRDAARCRKARQCVTSQACANGCAAEAKAVKKHPRQHRQRQFRRYSRRISTPTKKRMRNPRLWLPIPISRQTRQNLRRQSPAKRRGKPWVRDLIRRAGRSGADAAAEDAQERAAAGQLQVQPKPHRSSRLQLRLPSRALPSRSSNRRSWCSLWNRHPRRVPVPDRRGE